MGEDPAQEALCRVAELERHVRRILRAYRIATEALLARRTPPPHKGVARVSVRRSPQSIR